MNDEVKKADSGDPDAYQTLQDAVDAGESDISYQGPSAPAGPGPEYHHANGLYFSRYPDGTVRLHLNKLDHPNVEVTYMIPAAQWASIVAHVSARGGISETYTAATDLHMDEG